MLTIGVDVGGTKVAAGLVDEDGSIVARTRRRTPSASPADVEDVIAACVGELCEGAESPVGAVGIGAAGFVSGDRSTVLVAPNLSWRDEPLRAAVSARIDMPVVVENDANAAAWGEYRFGAGRGEQHLCVVTVGTGIGGGLVVGGTIVHGLMHPEMGHLLIRRHPDDRFAGLCSYHRDCAEGLASGPSVLARFGVTAGELPPDHPFQAILADYLGQLCAAIVLIAAPQRIVIGGGVMSGGGRLEPIAAAMREALGGYVSAPALHAARFLVSPAFENSGLVGAFLLATGA